LENGGGMKVQAGRGKKPLYPKARKGEDTGSYGGEVKSRHGN